MACFQRQNCCNFGLHGTCITKGSRKFDYCDSLPIGIRKVDLRKLKMGHNFLARAIIKTPKYISILYQYVPCLPIEQRIHVINCLTVHKILHFNQLAYLYMPCSPIYQQLLCSIIGALPVREQTVLVLLGFLCGWFKAVEFTTTLFIAFYDVFQVSTSDL